MLCEGINTLECGAGVYVALGTRLKGQILEMGPGTGNLCDLGIIEVKSNRRCQPHGNEVGETEQNAEDIGSH
jgi:hypothetical protein